MLLPPEGWPELPPEGWPELPPEGVSLCIGTVGFVYVTDTMLEYIAGLSLPFLALLMATQ